MRNYFLIVLVALLNISFSVRGENDVKQELKENDVKQNLKTIAAFINSQTPISMGMAGEIKSASLDGDTLTYKMSIDLFDNFGMQYDNPNKEINESVKEVMAASIKSDEMLSSFMNLLSDNGISFRFDVNLGTNNDLTYTLSPQDIKDVLSKDVDYKKIVAFNIVQMKKTLPMDLGEMKIVDYNISDDNLITTIIVDESKVNIENLRNNAPEIKSYLLNMLASGQEPMMENEFRNYSKAGYNTVYRYVGNITNGFVEVELSVNEILDILK